MRRGALNGLLKWLVVASAALMLPLGIWGCEKSSDPRPEDEPLVPDPNAKAPAPAVPQTDQPSGLDDYRKLAEKGDVSAMMLLGRSYESLGGAANRAEARKWYTKAATAGHAPATQAIAHMDEPPPVATQPAAPPETGPTNASASTKKADPSRVRWQEIVDSIDTKGFVTVANPNYKGKFIGLTTAPDKTMTLAATGVDEDSMEAVTVVMRLRNRQDPGNATRVTQTAAVVMKVTRDNVTSKEFVDWVTQYLSTGHKSEPVFRNGWKITITGTAGEGVNDPKSHLGEAIVVEMKK